MINSFRKYPTLSATISPALPASLSTSFASSYALASDLPLPPSIPRKERVRYFVVINNENLIQKFKIQHDFVRHLKRMGFFLNIQKILKILIYK